MEELDRIRPIFQLKNVRRQTKVKDGTESSADHSWACAVLADYFITRYSLVLDRTKVMKILLYHDLVEVESGDTYFMGDLSDKEDRENKGATALKNKLPSALAEEYGRLFEEYREAKTPEAQFAHAIDKLEPCIHLLDHKDEWRKKGFTEKNLREKKQPAIEKVPVLFDFFNQLMEFLKQNDYIPEK